MRAWRRGSESASLAPPGRFQEGSFNWVTEIKGQRSMSRERGEGILGRRKTVHKDRKV